MRVLAFIENHAILSGLSRANQERLALASKLLVIEPGEVVFNEGDVKGACFAVCFGSLKVFQTSQDGKEIVVKVLAQGDLFGEVALFDGGPYPATALALQSSTIIEIERSQFLHLLNDPPFRDDFIKSILVKLRYLTGKVYGLMAFDIEERFFRFLVEQFGTTGDYTIGLSKKDFAASIGTIPETFSRLLARLKDRGIIDWQGDRLKVSKEILKAYID